ncbi:phospholipase A1 member A-like [Leguminivora glycinivorella]|uniref:phospholipase A1 member A-like n=1 Tax=Leguminivora glycinivorella TaxID=1035111 RepID=UPI00200EEBDB|nr:phospholipase A1 member A-like [Leguminivora glycinivorella]
MVLLPKIIVAKFAIFFIISVGGVEYSRIDEGYPLGMIPDCPGSDKPAFIKPVTLKKLIISVVGDNHTGYSGHYNYYGINELPKNPDIDFSKKTWMYVGGYLDGNAWGTGLGPGYDYKARGYNVLSLDTLHFTAMHYPHAARLARVVGKHAAEMLAKLTKHGLDPKKLELTGMSLGGQTMSFIAKNYRRITGKNISSLVSLDPAGPCFRHLGPDQRLDKSDADFVATVLTTMDLSSISFPFSHVTFYVNGGAYQEGYFAWFPCDSICSHVRSFTIWWASVVYPEDFIAVKCDTVKQARDGDCYDIQPMVTNTMGPFIDKTKPGIYYLRTTNRWPFALGKKGLKKPRLVIAKSKESGTNEIDVPQIFKSTISHFLRAYT